MELEKWQIGDKVWWKGMGQEIDGTIKDIFTHKITLEIKGEKITRNGSVEKPAYLLESDAGELSLKLMSEIEKQSPSAF